MAKATTKNAAASAEETVTQAQAVDEVAEETSGKGKGKGKKAPEPEPTMEQLDAFQIPVKEIVVPETNPGRPDGKKESKEAFDAFCESVAKYGIIVPLIIRPREDGKYDLIAGDRRLRAAKRAKMLEVPCLINSNTKLSIDELAAMENVPRKDLDPVQKAVLIKSLVDAGRKQNVVAAMLGLDPSTIVQHMKLLTLSEETQTKVRNGYMTYSAALDLAKIEAATDPDVALEVKRKAEEKLAREKAAAAQKAAAKNLPKVEKPSTNGSGSGSGKGKQGGGTGRSSDAVQKRHVTEAAQEVADANPKAAKALKEAGVLKKQTVDFGVIVETYFAGSGVPAREAFADLYKGVMNGEFDGEAFAETFDSIIATNVPPAE